MNKTILITGAATRIGRVLATGLSQDGWRVIIHYNRSVKAAEDLASQLDGAIPIQADLSRADEAPNLINKSAQALGTPLTALINNASTYLPDSAADFTGEGFDNHMAVNVKAPLLLSQHFAKQLPKNIDGCIIHMIDQRVLRPSPEFFTYSVGKNALFAATKTMAQSFAPNIRVNAVGPGPTFKSIHQSDAEFTQEKASTLLGAGSPPDSILDAVRYLLKAKTVTGQMIAVDGGQHLRF